MAVRSLHAESGRPTPLLPPPASDRIEGPPSAMTWNTPSSKRRRRTNPTLSVGTVLFGDDDHTQEKDAELQSSPPSTQRSPRLAVTDACRIDADALLDKAMALEGAFAIALVDYDNGEMLDVRNTRHSFDIAAAATENAQLIRSQIATLQALDIVDSIKDISITCETEHHIVRPLSSGHLFLYLAIDRRFGHLGMARHSLAQIERELKP